MREGAARTPRLDDLDLVGDVLIGSEPLVGGTRLFFKAVIVFFEQLITLFAKSCPDDETDDVPLHQIVIERLVVKYIHD